MSNSSKKKTVYVGLSGGVDSSVAALRLLKRGFNVVGVFIKVWHPDFLKCNWEEERLDAMRVAAHLGIPFLTCDAEEDYKNEVGNYFIDEYKKGRTPNPDVMCNQYVKFGAFLKFALKNGADYIATGHYAQVAKEGDFYQMYRGVDTNKDQTYFLWTLTQKELSHTLFPVGDTPKSEIRKEADKAGLPTAIKKDSQGVCFLGHIDIPDFMSHFTELKEGSVLDVHGDHIGTHRGALVYTLGQRHGITIDSPTASRQPYYVVAKDLETNTIVVDTEPPHIPEDTKMYLENVNWIKDKLLRGPIEAQIRYRQTPFTVRVTSEENGDTYVTPSETIEKPSSGQSIVFYKDQKCLGGAVIK